jgi:tripartite-type tricarboxylate transporter receptor subunit TctC
MARRFQYLVLFVLFASIALIHAPLVRSQSYPTRPVKVIVPLAPGGGSDITARQFAAKLSEALGQQFVVDNRGGAGGLIGIEIAAKSAPDGYTLLMVGGGYAATAALQINGEEAIRALVPMVEFGITPFVLSVHPSVPVKTTRELIALTRAKPGQLAYASAGIGGITHLATELFARDAKIKLIHVPYKSTGAAMTDLLSGQVPVIVGSLLPMVPYIEAGRMRPLGVTTAKRWYSLPDIPALAEVLPGYDVELAFGALAPRGTPQAIIDTINAAVNGALAQAEMKKNLETQGMLGTGGAQQRYVERIRRDFDKWSKLVRDANIKQE